MRCVVGFCVSQNQRKVRSLSVSRNAIARGEGGAGAGGGGALASLLWQAASATASANSAPRGARREQLLLGMLIKKN